jgi:hypothetical protein
MQLHPQERRVHLHRFASRCFDIEVHLIILSACMSHYLRSYLICVLTPYMVGSKVGMEVGDVGVEELEDGARIDLLSPLPINELSICNL